MSTQFTRKTRISNKALRKLGIREVEKPHEFEVIGVITDQSELLKQGLRGISPGDWVGIRCGESGCAHIELTVFRTGQLQKIDLGKLNIKEVENPHEFEVIGTITNSSEYVSEPFTLLLGIDEPP